jgi:chromosome segregation ATPase
MFQDRDKITIASERNEETWIRESIVDALIEKTDEEIDSLKEKIEKVEEDAADLEIERDNLKEKVKELQEERDELEEKYVEVQEERNELLQTVKILEAQAIFKKEV